ncbi:MAG: hypothetical protein IT204_00230 [Fimbriimonadaceae bacterium]|nr:hypothetical protein [Fimbriimonadaceae bacterium]
MPVAQELTKDAELRAWPGVARSGPDLAYVHGIWFEARSRSTMEHYREFRNVLYTLFCQLVGYRASPREPTDIIEALRAQYAVFDQLGRQRPAASSR